MPRSGLLAYDAGPSDIPALVALCVDARSETGVQVGGGPAEDEVRTAQRLAALMEETGARVVLAAVDGVPVGFMFARLVAPGPLFLDPRAQIETLYVQREHRRQGAGHAMVAHLAAAACDHRAPEIVCLPQVCPRSLQRFFARLGFKPMAAHRVVSTETLMRRLSMDPTGQVLDQRRRDLEDLIARRRRTRGDTGEIPTVPTEANFGYPAEAIGRRKQVSRAVANLRSPSSTTTIS